MTSLNQDWLTQLGHLWNRFLTVAQTTEYARCSRSMSVSNSATVGFDLWAYTQDDRLETNKLRQRGWRYCSDQETDKWGIKSLMVWGGISCGQCAPLIVIDGMALPLNNCTVYEQQLIVLCCPSWCHSVSAGQSATSLCP